MGNEELHSKIENIEYVQKGINIRQLIGLVATTAILVFSATNFFQTKDVKQKDDNTEVVGEIKDLRNEMLNNYKDLRNDIRYNHFLDSLKNLQIKNSLDNQNMQTESHFLIIEEKIKHLKPVSYSPSGVTERRESGTIALIPSHTRIHQR